MSYRPGDIFYQQFCVSNVSGIAVNADSTPNGVLVRNGLDDFTPKLFVTNVDTGRYTVSGIIPSTYLKDWSVGVAISGYVNGNFSKFPLSLGVLDSMLVGDILTTAGITVSITGTAPNNFIVPTSIRNDVTVSVTGTLPQVIIASGGWDQIQSEYGVNARQMLSLVGAVLAGSSTTNGNNITYYACNNQQITRLTSTAVSGARQVITISLP